jgi:DDE superfamily endonuclease
MAKPYSLDLRERVADAVLSGRSCGEVASTFGVSVASAVKWAQRLYALRAAPRPSRWPYLLADDEDGFWPDWRLVPHLTVRSWPRSYAPGALRSATTRYGINCAAPGSASKKALHHLCRAVPRAHPQEPVTSHHGTAGAKLLFLPPYSPDLNPIEQVFTKLKLVLRKAAERSVEATWKRIGTLLHAFPPLECANYLRNSGYA